MSATDEIRAAADQLRAEVLAAAATLPVAPDLSGEFPDLNAVIEHDKAGRDLRVKAAIIDMLDKWAWIGLIDPDMLNRVGGPEILRIAQLINQQPLGRTRRIRRNADAPKNIGYIRMYPTTLQVLKALLEADSEYLYGYDLRKMTGMPSGTLYPILHRLADHGVLHSEVESVNAVGAGRPARTYYTLTKPGRQWATRQVETAQNKADNEEGQP